MNLWYVAVTKKNKLISVTSVRRSHVEEPNSTKDFIKLGYGSMR
jgi:hypothetical protein